MEPWDAQQEAKKEAGRRGGLVNQQRIRDAKTSSALANKLNKENKETLSISPRGDGKKEGGDSSDSTGVHAQQTDA